MNYTAENFSLGTTTSSSFFPSQPIDLSGKLIIKAQLGDDIRRIPIHNEELTYDELLLMMQRVFRGRLNSTDDVTIKYKDEDGDLVTMFDSSDLAVAKSMSRIIRITLFVNGVPRPPEHKMVEEFRRELSHLRDRVLYLLDRLEIGDFGSTGGKVEEEKVPEKKNLDDSKSQKQQKPPESQAPSSTSSMPTYPSVNTAIFDPLQPKNDQQTVSSTSDLGGKPDDQGYPSQPKPATSQLQPSASQPTSQQSMSSPYSQKTPESYTQQNQQSYATPGSVVAQPQGYSQQSYSSMTTGTYPQSQTTSMGYQNYASNQPQTTQGYVPGGPPHTDGYTRAYSPQLQQQQLQQPQQQPQQPQQQPQQPQQQQQQPQQPIQQQQQGVYQGYQTQKMNYPPQSTYDYSSGQYYKYS